MDAQLAGRLQPGGPLVFISGNSLYVFAGKGFKPTFVLALHREMFPESQAPQFIRKLNYKQLYDILTRFAPDRISPAHSQNEQQLQNQLTVLVSRERIKVYKLTNSRYRNWFGDIDNFIIRDQNMIDTIIHRKTSDVEQNRYDLQVELNKILGARWSEKIRMDDIYWSEPWYTRALIVTGKTMLNVYEGIEGLFKLGAMIIEATGDAINFQLKLAGHMVDGEFEKAKKQLEDQGIKIANSVEEMKKQIEAGYAILEPIMNDPESRDIVVDFLSEYVDSMSVVDKGAAALTIPFEVLLALASAGLGAAVAGSGAVRHAGQFTGRAIELLVGLSKAISKVKLDKKVEINNTNKRKSVGRKDKSSTTNKNSDNIKSTDKVLANPLGQSTTNKILSIKKGSRPDPSTYLSKEYMDAHSELFKEGAARIQPSAPVGKIGRTETWVLPKKTAQDAIAKANGDPRKLEELLGLDKGYLGESPVLVNIKKSTGYRIPSGNEFAAYDDFWRPAGLTHPGGLPEAVIDPVQPGGYTVSRVF